jgi:hypothetical protein
MVAGVVERKLEPMLLVLEVLAVALEEGAQEQIQPEELETHQIHLRRKVVMVVMEGVVRLNLVAVVVAEHP